MQIVIDIPEKTANKIKDNVMFAGTIPSEILWDVSSAISNGTPLPAGHGRLGDLDFVAKRIKAKPPIGEIGKVTLEECYQEILQADTIIEADKENRYEG